MKLDALKFGALCLVSLGLISGQTPRSDLFSTEPATNEAENVAVILQEEDQAEAEFDEELESAAQRAMNSANDSEPQKSAAKRVMEREYLRY